MADITTVQQMQGASLDAQALEKFINGSDSETVLTRLNAKYPTLQKAIKELFENGNVAGRFKTLAELQTSTLKDGDYALVADDVVEKNGIYIKEAGTWKLSKYDIRDALNRYADELMPIEQKDVVDLKPIPYAYINTKTPESSLIIEHGSAYVSYIKIDVSDASCLVVENSKAHSTWNWVFTDINNAYISKSYSKTADGTYPIPSNAKWAYRTFESRPDGIGENASFKVTKLLKNKTVTWAAKHQAKIAIDELKNSIYSSGIEKIDISPKTGFAVDELYTSSSFFATNTNAKYIEVDAKKYSKLIVKGSAWQRAVRWVFMLDDGSKYVPPSFSTGDGEFEVPRNAVKAFRAIYFTRTSPAETLDDTTGKCEIFGVLRDVQLLPMVNNLQNAVKQLSGQRDLLDIMPDISSDMMHMISESQFLYPNDFEGVTQTAKIKNAIAFAKQKGFGIVALGYDEVNSTNTWTITETLVLPSNCWIYINNCTVKQADGVLGNMFRNDGIVLPPDTNPYGFAPELNRNENIRIFGNNPKLSVIKGNRENPYKAPHPLNGGDPIEWVGDEFGWKAIKILFANTHNYRVHNLTISDVTSWSILNEQGCSNYKYHDIIFNNNVKNGDGINNGMGCHDFEIYNISGRTSDDTIAIHSVVNLYDNKYPSGEYIFPKLIGGHSDRGFGIKTYNAKVWNIEGDGSNAGVLLLWSGGGQIDNIDISDVRDGAKAFIFYAVRVGNAGAYGSAPKMGELTNLTINRITSSTSTGNVVELIAPLQDVWVNNITLRGKATSPIVLYGAGYKSKNVKVTNVRKA